EAPALACGGRGTSGAPGRSLCARCCAASRNVSRITDSVNWAAFALVRTGHAPSAAVPRDRSARTDGSENTHLLAEGVGQEVEARHDVVGRAAVRGVRRACAV